MTRTSASSTAESSAFDAVSSGRVPPTVASKLHWVRRMASEPFVHFTLLGALVFAGHRWIAGKPEVPSIEVSASKQRELVKLFEQRQKRAPSETERRQLIERHVEEEALFREGLRLSIIHTDPLLREQIVARVRATLQSELDAKPPSESELQRYFSEHRAEYAIPETISYREYWIQRGPEAGGDARRLLAALNEPNRIDGVEGFIPTDYARRSKAQLIALYDPVNADALWALPNGHWQELRSERGIHIVRVNAHAPALEPPFSDVRERVRTAYRKAQLARGFQARLTGLTSQWRVNIAENR